MNPLVVLFALASQIAPVDAQGKPVVVIDVEADVIEGTLHRPDHILVKPHHKPVFKSLIENRKDFREKVFATGSHI